MSDKADTPEVRDQHADTDAAAGSASAGRGARPGGGEPGGGEPGVDLTEAQRAFLSHETDHFFQGEMAHEQRASWLLALASGLLIALWRLLGISNTANLSDLAFWLLIATLVTLVVTVALSLFALWPLGGGRDPGLLRPWRNRFRFLTAGEDLPPVPDRFRGAIGPIVWQHYVGHRRRAEVKGIRVVRVALSLFVALVLGAAGILASLLEFAL